MATAFIFSTEVLNLQVKAYSLLVESMTVHESDSPLCACWPMDPLGCGTAHATLGAGTWAQPKQPVAGEVEVLSGFLLAFSISDLLELQTWCVQTELLALALPLVFPSFVNTRQKIIVHFWFVSFSYPHAQLLSLIDLVVWSTYFFNISQIYSLSSIPTSHFSSYLNCWDKLPTWPPVSSSFQSA